MSHLVIGDREGTRDPGIQVFHAVLDVDVVLEVLRALTVTTGMSWAQLAALADHKRIRHGGFEKRIFLESVV